MLDVDIVTPERAVYRGPAGQVVLPAWEGELGVLPDHDALLCLVRAGTCTVYADTDTRRYVIGRGFAEISPTRVTILTDNCELASDVDKAKAAADMHAAEVEMSQHEPTSEKYRQAQIAYELARARVEA